MENIFINGYHKRVVATGSVLCPKIVLPEHVPFGYKYPKAGNYLQSVKDYLCDLIDSISEMVPAVEFQRASYSILGKKGEALLRQLIDRAQRRHLCTILDVNFLSNTGTRESVEKVFDTYGVDACTFAYTPDFSCCKEWLERGHMPIFTGPKTNLDQESDGLEVCQYVADMARRWNAEVVEIHEFAGIGCLVKAKEAARCRRVAGDEVFFLISLPDGSRDFKADEFIDGLMDSCQHPMGAVNNLDITLSWWDEKKKKPREGKTLDLVKTAVHSANVNLNAAIERKFGKQQKEG